MSSITLDIPTNKNPVYLQEVFHTLVHHYTEEDIEDIMLGLHMSQNTPGNTIDIATLRSKYARHLS